MANEILGSDALIIINSYRFEVKEGTIKETRSTARTDVTGGGIVQGHKVDKAVLNLNFKALRYSTLIPHAAPYNIASSGEQDWSDIVVYPNRADEGDLSKSWRFYGVWTEYSEQFNADQGLLTLDAACVSTEGYSRPGDAA
jgi:hypothetical protein